MISLFKLIQPEPYKLVKGIRILKGTTISFVWKENNETNLMLKNTLFLKKYIFYYILIYEKKCVTKRKILVSI